MLHLKNTVRLWAVAVLITGTNAYADYSKEYHETFKVTKETKVVLHHGDGEVTVRPWDRPELQVDVYYRAAGKDEDDKLFRVDFDQRGDRIYITGKEFYRSWNAGGWYTKEYRFEIKAPAYIAMELEGDDGNVTITGWRKNLSIDLSDGDVDLQDIKADLIEVDLEDGDLQANHLDGELSVDCQDGKVTLEDVKSSRADIRNQDGSIKIGKARGNFRLRLEDGNCRIYDLYAEKLDIQAQDGNVDVQLSGAVSPNIRANCQDGNIDLELPPDIDAELQINARHRSVRGGTRDMRIEKDEKGYFRGILGSGQGTIELSARDGRVTVRR